MTNSEYVEARLAHGSLCHLCPLRGQRKVGKDGPIDAEIIGIAEAPGEDEERWGARRGHKYGTPLVGASGFRLRLENLAQTDPPLIDVIRYEDGRRPTLVNLRALLLNVILCRPPGNDIDSAVGQKAVQCCVNSLRWFLRERLAANPHVTVVPIGGTSLSAMRRRETKIDAHRGRVTHVSNVVEWAVRTLAPEPETEIAKRVLKGQKPKEVWWPAIEWFLRRSLVLNRASLRRTRARMPADIALHVSIVKLVIAKQRAVLRKRAAKGDEK